MPSNWYALQVGVRRENLVSELLRSKGYEEFLPIIAATKKARATPQPLFPGYLFCRVSFDVRGALVVTTPGVIRILSAGRVPIPVPDRNILDLKILISSGLPLTTGGLFAIGEMVEVTRGPLAGLQGKLIHIRNASSLVLELPLMGRSVLTNVDIDCVSKVYVGSGHSARIARAG